MQPNALATWPRALENDEKRIINKAIANSTVQGEKMSLNKLKQDMQRQSSPERKKACMWFFKTGPGQYGEGDVFIGLSNPQMRALAKEYKELLKYNESVKETSEKFWNIYRTCGKAAADVFYNNACRRYNLKVVSA